MKTPGTLLFSALIIFTIEASGQSLISVAPDTVCLGDSVTFYITGQNTTFMLTSPTGQVQGVDLRQSPTVITSAYYMPTTDTTLLASFFIPISTSTFFYDLRVHTFQHGTLTLTGGVYIDACLGTGFSDNDLPVTLAPNPATDHTGLFIDDPSLSNLDIEIYNVDGRKVIHRLGAQAEHGYLEIATSSLVPGIYILKATADGRCAFAKLVIQPRGF